MHKYNSGIIEAGLIYERTLILQFVLGKKYTKSGTSLSSFVFVIKSRFSYVYSYFGAYKP